MDSVEYKFLEHHESYDVYWYDFPGESDSMGGLNDNWRTSGLIVLAMGGKLRISNDVYIHNGVTPLGIPRDKLPLVKKLFEGESGPIAEAIVKRLK